MSAYDDLLEERYGRATHAWWKTPERTLDEDVAALQRRMLLKATQADELKQARRGAA